MGNDNDLFGIPPEDLNESPETSNDFDLYDSSDSQMTFDTSFHAINATASAQTPANPQTVSPKDIFSDTMSAPPSGAYTNISTPGTYSLESPYLHMVTSNETSPAFQDDELDGDDETKKWPSLFPEEPSFDDSFTPAARVASQVFEVPVAPPMSRNQSSPGQSSARGSNQGRHSSISGVNPRKRDKPLPPITVEDPTDTVAVKRARNTAAARKSRQKKMEKFDELEEVIKGLQEDVEYWKGIALQRTGGQV